jgi:hypothetical protein
LHPEKRTTTGWQAGSIIFLVVAVLLAIFSGDVLLVLAVGSAIAGIGILARQRRGAVVSKRGAVPFTHTAAIRASKASKSSRGHVLGGQKMAVRRRHSVPITARRVAQRSGAAQARVADSSSNVQVVKALQQS